MKIARLIGILSLLLQHEQLTANQLSEHFEVSARTIYRDIEALCQAGIPLVTEQGRGGGVAIMSGYKIDRTLLSTADMQAILAGLRSLDSCGGTNRYQQLMAKLAPEGMSLLPADQAFLINLASWDKAALAPKLELLHRAIAEGRQAAFTYCGPNGETERLIEPYNLLFQWAGWYVWGWCSLRQDWRLFKLSRMLELRLEDCFEPRPVPAPDLRTEKVFPTVLQVRAVFQPQCKWRLLDDYGPDSFEPLPDGRLLFNFGFTDKENLLGWLLTFGGNVELLEPAELRQELKQLATDICQIYSEI